MPQRTVPTLTTVLHLDDLQPGERAMVLSVGGEGTIRRRLLDLGFVRGTIIEVVRRAPMWDPIEYRLRGFNLSLRAREAHLVEVRRLPIAPFPPVPSRGRGGRRRGRGRHGRGWLW